MKSIQPAPKPNGWRSPRNLARYSIICAAGTLISPIPLMLLGSVLGVLAVKRGEVKLGAVGLALSILLGITSWAAAVYVVPA